MPISRRLLFGTIATRLVGITNATGYYGQVGRPLTVPAPAGWVADPPVKADNDPRVKPYFVLYPGPGVDGPDSPLVGLDEGLGLDFDVRTAAGDVDDLLALVDRIEARLVGWVPVLAGVVCGPVGRFPGYRPPFLPDKTVSPERQFTPLKYVLTVTT